MPNDGGRVTALRRGATMIVLDALGQATVKQLVDALHEAIDGGTIAWALNDWQSAPKRPYYAGTSQHLEQLARKDPALVESKRKNGVATFALTKAGCDVLPELRSEQTAFAVELLRCDCGAEKASEDPWCPDCTAAEAERLLPHPPERFLMIAARYRAATGCEVAFGVTPELTRVIRVQTLRGLVEHEIPDEMPWTIAAAKWLG